MMANKVRHHIEETVGGAALVGEADLAPKSLTKIEFGRRLYRLMLNKGWNQSELARQANLPRYMVSVYIRGKSLPTPPNVKRLAEALNVPETALLPNIAQNAIGDDETPAFEMKVSSAAPSTAWLRVNQLVSTTTAMKIAELLSSDEVVNRVRSSGDS